LHLARICAKIDEDLILGVSDELPTILPMLEAIPESSIAARRLVVLIYDSYFTSLSTSRSP
jgi:hypothetical protein